MPNFHCLQINIFQTLHLDTLIKLLRDRIRTGARDARKKSRVLHGVDQPTR